VSGEIVRWVTEHEERVGLPRATDADRAHLKNNLRDFEQAWSELVMLAEALIVRMETIDRVRPEIAKHGITVGVDPGEIGLIELDAALRRHRELRRDRAYEPPEWAR
jgi:hypothetical protein